VRKIKISELIIVCLFLIGLVLALTQDIETDQTPEATIAEVPLKNNMEIEPTI